MAILKKNKIDSNIVIKYGMLAGLTQYAYILAIIFIINNIDSIFRVQDERDFFLGPVLFLSIFVFSATISGLIMLGAPAYFIFHKKYPEAAMTLLVGLAALFMMAVLTFLILINF